MGSTWFRLCALSQGKRAGEGRPTDFKRRCEFISAENTQRDYALAA